VALTGEVFEELRASFISSHDSSPVSQRRGRREEGSPSCGRAAGSYAALAGAAGS
jgi:hypothetical protein